MYLPTFQIGGIPGSPYSLTPLGNSQIAIKSADNSVTYMTGTLAVGDLGTIGTVAGGYTQFQADISNLVITHEGAVLGSAALAILQNMQLPSLDFDLSFTGGSGPGYYSFADMLDRGGLGRRRIQRRDVRPGAGHDRPAGTQRSGDASPTPLLTQT